MKPEELINWERLLQTLEEVKKEGWGEVNFKITVQAGKIVSVVLFKTASYKLG